MRASPVNAAEASLNGSVAAGLVRARLTSSGAGGA